MQELTKKSGRLRGAVLCLGLTLTLALVGACTTGSDSVTAASTSDPTHTQSLSAVVDEIVSGDSILILRDGVTEQVQLINVAAPDPDSIGDDSGCLGAEARDFVETLIPVGSAVTLEFDSDVSDEQGRSLAAVRTVDGELVNSAITTQGLGITVPVGSNTRFLDEIAAGQQAARTAQTGLYSSTGCTLAAALESVDCGLTFAGQTTGVTETTPTTEVTTSASLADLSVLDASRATQIAERALDTAQAVHQRFAGSHTGLMWAAFTEDQIAEFTDYVSRSVSACSSVLDEATSTFVAVSKAAAKAKEENRARKAAAEKLRAEKAAAEKAVRQEEKQRAAEAKALAQQQAAQERAEAQAVAEAERLRLEEQAAAELAHAQAEQAQAEQAQADQAEAERAASEAAAQQEESNNSNSGGSGYTGPRCYAPGGQTWTAC